VVDKANIDFYHRLDKSKYRLLSPLRVAAQEAQNGDKRVDKQSIEQNDTAVKNIFYASGTFTPGPLSL
jgi:hypothetical protein